MAFQFSSAQISGLQVFDNGFRLNNPLALHVTRMGVGGAYDVDLYLKNHATDQEILVFEGIAPASYQSLNGPMAFSESAWLMSEGKAISSTRVLNAKSLFGNKFSYWPTGDYSLLARTADGSVLEAIEYSANANALEASFEDGLKVSIGSLNTIIKIPTNELTKIGGYAEDIRYSLENYQRSAQSLLKFHDQLPIETMQPLPIPVKRADGKILVQYQFNPSNSTFGVDGLHPVVKVTENQDFTILNPSEYSPVGTWGSAEQIKDNGGDTGDYPWYSAITSDGPTFDSYFSSRREQYDPELAFGTRNNLDPYYRGAGFTGSPEYRYVVTLAVDPSTIFRPKGGVEGSLDQQAEGQSWSNTIPGPLPDVFQRNASGNYEVDKEAEKVPWFSDLDASGFKVWDDDKKSWQSFPTFGSWYRNNWNNTEKTTFPWTGLGYTYDPYYPTDADWGKNPPLGPATAEFVQLWRPDGNSDERWNYEILDVQTVPEAFGASTQDPNRSEPLKLVVKSLGFNETDLFFYEADSVTGLIDDPTGKNGGVAPTDPEYLELAIEQSKKAGTFLLDNELPEYREKQTFGEDLGLMSGKNYGIVIKVKSPEKEYFYSSYGDTSNQFIPLSDPQKNGFAIGFEDTKIGVGDNDFNDLILEFANFSNQL